MDKNSFVMYTTYAEHINLASQLDNETLMRNICDALDIDYDEIKGKLPNPDEAENEAAEAQKALDGVNADESETEGNATGIS